MMLLSFIFVLLFFGLRRFADKLDGLSVPASTAEYVHRGTGMSGFPRRSFDHIPPNDDW